MATKAEFTVTLRVWTDKPRDHLRGDKDELFDHHLEHVFGMIQRGFTSGEIVDERFRGWWETKFEQSTPK